MKMISKYLNGFQIAIENRINIYISYFNVVYFFEIIYFMVVLNILYGNKISVAAGILLGIFLTAQIIRIYFKRRSARITQLLFMELHIAYSLPLLISMTISGYRLYSIDFVFSIFRVLVCIIEVVMIFILTSRAVIRKFDC